jgi:hypothetical protein
MEKGWAQVGSLSIAGNGVLGSMIPAFPSQRFNLYLFEMPKTYNFMVKRKP